MCFHKHWNPYNYQKLLYLCISLIMGEICALFKKEWIQLKRIQKQKGRSMVISCYHYTTKTHQLTALKMLGINNTYIQYINLKTCTHKLCQACETKLILLSNNHHTVYYAQHFFLFFQPWNDNFNKICRPVFGIQYMHIFKNLYSRSHCLIKYYRLIFSGFKRRMLMHCIT